MRSDQAKSLNHEASWPRGMIIESILGACALPAAMAIGIMTGGDNAVMGYLILVGLALLLFTLVRSMIRALRVDTASALLRTLGLAAGMTMLALRRRELTTSPTPLFVSLGALLVIILCSALAGIRWPRERSMLPLTIGLAALGEMIFVVLWVDTNE